MGASASDDQCAAYWDMVAEQRMLSFKEHSDFVRSLSWVWSQPHCLLTGSYDHSVKLWDCRNDGASERSFDHKYPVDAVLSIPNSDLFAVAGGPSVSVWSMRKPDAPLFKIGGHLKSVTSLATNEAGSRLLTGSMDKFVRVFAVQNSTGSLSRQSMKSMHSFRVPSGVLSLDMSTDDKRIAIGTLSDGLIVRGRGDGKKEMHTQLKVREYQNDPTKKLDDDVHDFMENRKKQRFWNDEQRAGEADYHRVGEGDWFERGKKFKLPSYVDVDKLKPIAERGKTQIEEIGWNVSLVRHKPKKYKKWDTALRKFEHKRALDLTLETQDVVTVHSMLEELWRREALEIAFGGRNAKELTPLLQYLLFALGHPHLAQTALHCTALILDYYKDIVGLSDRIDFLFQQIADVIDHQVTVHKILLKVQGAVEMILSAQDIAANPLPPKMLGLRDRINAMMERTKAMYESKQNGHVNDGSHEDSNRMDDSESSDDEPMKDQSQPPRL